MKELLHRMSKTIQNAPCWAEMRYHKRYSQTVQVQKGLVKQARANTHLGLGVRCLVNGVWGFSSTSDLTEKGIERALKAAFEAAQSLSQLKKSKLKSLPEVSLAQGEYILPGYQELQKMPLEEKLASVLFGENKIRLISPQIETAVCSYSEQFEDKIVVSTDGARALSQLCRNEIRLAAIASAAGEMTEGQQTVGRTGNWDCLFSQQSIEQLGEGAAQLAIDLLRAPKTPGGKATVI